MSWRSVRRPKSAKGILLGILWPWKSREMLLFCDLLVCIYKEMQRSKLGMWEGYQLPIDSVRKGYLFCQNWSLPVKTSFEYYPRRLWRRVLSRTSSIDHSSSPLQWTQQIKRGRGLGGQKPMSEFQIPSLTFKARLLKRKTFLVGVLFALE